MFIKTHLYKEIEKELRNVLLAEVLTCRSLSDSPGISWLSLAFFAMTSLLAWRRIAEDIRGLKEPCDMVVVAGRHSTEVV